MKMENRREGFGVDARMKTFDAQLNAKSSYEIRSARKYKKHPGGLMTSRVEARLQLGKWKENQITSRNREGSAEY